MAGEAAAGSGARPDRLSRAIDGFLTYLRVERGLSDATLRAYRSDLLDFAASRGASASWDSSAETPIHYLSVLGAPGRGGRPALRPTTLRRRAASLRGFYRFATRRARSGRTWRRGSTCLGSPACCRTS